MKTRISSSSRFPANFISEAMDQTRGWFYTLLRHSDAACSIQPAFHNCIVLGHVQDKDGPQDEQAHRQRSRSLGAFWTSRARTLCAGISTPAPCHGCPTASPQRPYRESQRKYHGNASGTPTPSTFFMRTSTTSTPTRHKLVRENLTAHGQVDTFPPEHPHGPR